MRQSYYIPGADVDCECSSDGFCQRYNRHMSGRMRDLCAGVDVDLGTAAAFREQWRREAHASRPHAGPPRPLLLKTNQAPGDAVAMTAAIYSLHRAYPGRYLTSVESMWPEVFLHNPDVVPAPPGAAEVRMHYPAIHQSNDRGIHFMQGWCEHLGAALDIPLPLLTDRPRLYFNTPDPPAGDYWIVCSGGKRDMTAKMWGHDTYQHVVSLLKNRMKFVQVGSLEHDHKRLAWTKDGRGTTLRVLFELIRRARGVLCGVSLLMHVAAALDKPAVVIAGGREPVSWNAYPKQQYVHTIGSLPCTDLQGHVGRACWRSRTVPLGDGFPTDRDTCERPVDGTPMCMSMIKPLEVANLILRYNHHYDHNADSTE